MPHFKVNDLMIDVVSADLRKLSTLCLFPTKQCPFRTLICPDNTYILCRLNTNDCPGPTNDPCGVNYSTCWMTDIFILDLERLIINPADIGIVREQLEQVFKAVETRGAEVAESMQPRTREQVDFLEQRLTEALEQIRAMRDRIG